MEEELSEFAAVGADLVLTKPLTAKNLDLLLRFFAEHGVQTLFSVIIFTEQV